MKSKMADRAKREKLRNYSTYFPLVSVESVIDLFRSQVTGGANPDLTLLSIVLGAVENSLTTGDRSIQPVVGASDDDASGQISPFPEPIRFNEIEALYQRFTNLLKGAVDLGPSRGPNKKTLRTSLELIKNVSNVIWAGLSSSYYKDRAHIQSIYSFLTGSKLDSFGVALSVVAACQLLGLDDVHLALTEEHSWVVFGDDGLQSIEVTWHGKGVEDKRGQPVTLCVTDKSWLYLNGRCVTCDRHMEVAAMVTSINPSIAASFDSPELTSIQQQLLWMLYDGNCLNRYPMGITNIGDLEEINPTPGRPSPEALLKKAIESAKTHYDNMHVYPYTYLAGYYYRMKRFKEALTAWAEASQVISKYNYHRDDEEVYKEFLEIANELIPNAIRFSIELSQSKARSKTDMTRRSDLPVLQDPECCALFLKFYDGICEWEEGSSTPVLHITWATHMLNSLSKFEPDTRARVRPLDFVDETVASNLHEAVTDSNETMSDKNGNCTKDITGMSVKSLQRKPGRPPKRNSSTRSSMTDEAKLNGKNNTDAKQIDKDETELKETPWKYRSRSSSKLDDGESCLKPGDGDEDQIKSTIEELISRVGDSTHSLEPDPTIVALGHACGESILNPAFLLGKGEPFATKYEINDGFESTVGSPYSYSFTAADVPVSKSMNSVLQENSRSNVFHDLQHEGDLVTGNGSDKVSDAVLYLRSTKMKEMKELLTAKKLNGNAIKLHLTAQSQVIIKHSRPASEFGFGYGKPVKRLKRD